MLEMPPIRSYTKADIRYLLRNPETDLNTRTCKLTKEPVVPISSHTLTRNLQRHLERLRIASIEEYRRLKNFSPSQVETIFEILL